MKFLFALPILLSFSLSFAEVSCDSSDAALTKAVTDLKKCKVVTFLLAGAAGGGSDKITRDISSQLGKLGVTSVIVNQPGANGHVAAGSMKTNTDPCKFLVASNANLSLNALHPNLKPKIDPITEFEPVSLVSTAPMVLAAHRSVKNHPGTKKAISINNLGDLLNAIKTESLFYGSSGVGGFSHLLGAKLEQLGQSKDDVHVPYVGSSQAALGLGGGEQVHFLFESPSTIYKMYKARPKDIVILGSTGNKPIQIGKSDPIMPLWENYPKLKDLSAQPYIGILASKGSGQIEQNRLAMEKTISCIVRDEKFRKPHEELGYVIGNGSAAALRSTMSEYTPNSGWGKAYLDLNLFAYDSPKIKQNERDGAEN